MNIEELAVICEADDMAATGAFEKAGLSVHTWPDDIDSGAELLTARLADGREGFILYGSDSLIGQVVTALWRRRELAAQSVSLWPVDEQQGLVAQACGATASASQALRQIRRGKTAWQRNQLGTLKISDSTQPAARYGFSFATGWVYRAYAARARARGGAQDFLGALGKLATDTLGEERDESLARRMTVDHKPQAQTTGSLVASTLDKTYFGLDGRRGGARMWNNLETKSLVRRALTPDLLARSGPRAEPFEALHLDTPAGWLLDGRRYELTRPGVVQVMPGPTVTFYSPSGGLRSRMQSFLSSGASGR